VTDASGAVVSRHDYMPFGIEIGSTISGRTTAMGYGASDGVRDQFTGQQRDTETGLDFFQARYYSNSHGRFLSADPLLTSADPHRPQTWNRYAYVLNNPLKLVDPSGMSEQHPSPEDSSADLHGSGGGGALTGGAYRWDGERESTEEAAVETGISESIDHELAHTLEPQNTLTEDDPVTIPGQGNSTNCSISVSFELGTYYDNAKTLPNGPTTFNNGSHLGLGFTVTGTAKTDGGVGKIGEDVNPQNPKGAWKIDQWTSNYATKDGAFDVIKGRTQAGRPLWYV